jgi:hypothetical protein
LAAQVSSEPLIEVDASTATATAPASPVCNNDVSKSSVGTRVTRPFKREWLTKYPWLIYDETNYKAFCSTCQNANQKRLLDSSKSVKQSFISDRFNNWKHVRLILTVPVTTCSAERAFSGLRRLKAT